MAVAHKVQRLGLVLAVVLGRCHRVSVFFQGCVHLAAVRSREWLLQEVAVVVLAAVDGLAACRVL